MMMMIVIKIMFMMVIIMMMIMMMPSNGSVATMEFTGKGNSRKSPIVCKAGNFDKSRFGSF